ncbi:MAG: poly(A) polymerase [Pseudohongiellaceae bacterium]|jgi:poly(A) polymerase
MNHSQSNAGFEKARLVERDQHSVSRRFISDNALKVLSKLSAGNFEAYLVGGCVRDILLGNKPKDFDVATSATPEEVRALFKNAHIIGRRFKIVHIRFGREIIEVTTFRAPHIPNVQQEGKHSRKNLKDSVSAQSSSGMILRDNVYGNIDEDAARRDFTINALYYTLDQFRILDFCDGLKDLNEGLIRMIGDPESRYREDPVRMLRALRFAAKLQFEIEPATLKPIDELAHLLESISPARLFDETIKLLTGGQAAATFELIRNCEVGYYLFPPTLNALAHCDVESARLLDLALLNTDTRLAEEKSVTPAFLFAALLWPVLTHRIDVKKASLENDYQAFQIVANEVLLEQLQYTAIPKRFSLVTKDIWEMQLRLTRRNRRGVENVFAHPKFRAAYDFLLLREDSGEDLDGLGQWWTEYQIANDEQRLTMISSAPGANQSKPRRRPRKKQSSS